VGDLRSAELLERAAREQPDLAFDRTGFAAHVERVLAAVPDERADTLHAGDLALAFACAHQDPAALRVFEATCIPALHSLLVRRGYDSARVDDVLQDLRQQFLMGTEDKPPKLLAYGGRGPLAAWLRVAAVRQTLDEHRKHWREVPLEDAMIAPPVVANDPLREERLTLLRTSLRMAITELTSRQRALARLYYVDELGVEALGRMFQVHASTVSRWLAQARSEMLEKTRTALRTVAAASPSEVDSMLAHAASLEVDLQSLLRTHE
jgi:RNA polymerase sigma-70 factor (ECF subfamily)